MRKLPNSKVSSKENQRGLLRGFSPLIGRTLLVGRSLNKRHQRKKTLKLNALGRLESVAITRRVLDNPFRDTRDQKLNEQVEKASMGLLGTNYYKVWTNEKKLFFRKDSNVCRDRQRKRDMIMKRTGGKGLKVKDAKWSLMSFIQCK